MSSCRKIQDGVNWKCTQVHGRFTFSLGFKFIVAKLLDINYFEFSRNEHTTNLTQLHFLTNRPYSLWTPVFRLFIYRKRK